MLPHVGSQPGGARRGTRDCKQVAMCALIGHYVARIHHSDSATAELQASCCSPPGCAAQGPRLSHAGKECTL